MDNVFAKVAYVIATADPKDGEAYTDGDVVGGLLTFAIPGPTGYGVLNCIVVVDDDNEGADLDLFLFSSAPTTIADDAAFTPSAADLKKLIYKCAIASGDYATENSLQFVIKNNLDTVFETDGGSNLYGYLVCNGSTPTYAADKTLHIRLGILTQD